MTQTPETAGTALWRDERHGPLPGLLLVLTMLTGLVDAVSYLALGHVFVANMTGNVVFLGFAIAGAKDLSISSTLIATGAFLVGALAGGRLGAALAIHRGRLLAIAGNVKLALVAVAFVLSLAGATPENDYARYAFVGLLALAMGVQNATARRLAVPDLTTTVLTLTLTGLAADSSLAGGKNPNPWRRIMATVAMFAGAAIGALLLLRVSVAAVLGLALALLAVNVIVAHRIARSSEAWTVGG
jgi:uncharacterized membrane protein YoaK (UPF0700 family)